MIDIKQEKQKPVKADPTDMLLAEVEVREADPKQPHRKKTDGEVLFDRGVYTGIGFGVNELSSLAITDQFVNGKPKWFLGGKIFSQEGYEMLGNKMAKALKWTPEKAKNSLLMAVLLVGGSLLVYPMKKMEDNKEFLVKKANHWLDNMRGNKMTAEDVAARDLEVEKTIACQSKQTWPSILVGRGAAMLASWATGTFLVGKKNNDKISAFTERTFAGSIQPVGQKNTWHRWMAIIGMETYSCAISSTVLELSSKLFAKHGVTVHNPELCTQSVHEKEQKDATTSGSSGNPTSSTDSKEMAAGTVTTEETVTATVDKFLQYKKKTIVTQDSHVDSVAASTANLALAP